jgi:hypothetical protein
MKYGGIINCFFAAVQGLRQPDQISRLGTQHPTSKNNPTTSPAPCEN